MQRTRSQLEASRLGPQSAANKIATKEVMDVSAIEVMDVSATWTLMHRCWRRRVGIRWRMAGCTSTTTHARPQSAANKIAT